MALQRTRYARASFFDFDAVYRRGDGRAVGRRGGGFDRTRLPCAVDVRRIDAFDFDGLYRADGSGDRCGRWPAGKAPPASSDRRVYDFFEHRRLSVRFCKRQAASMARSGKSDQGRRFVLFSCVSARAAGLSNRIFDERHAAGVGRYENVCRIERAHVRFRRRIQLPVYYRPRFGSGGRGVRLRVRSPCNRRFDFVLHASKIPRTCTYGKRRMENRQMRFYARVEDRRTRRSGTDGVERCGRRGNALYRAARSRFTCGEFVCRHGRVAVLYAGLRHTGSCRNARRTERRCTAERSVETLCPAHDGERALSFCRTCGASAYPVCSRKFLRF